MEYAICEILANPMTKYEPAIASWCNCTRTATMDWACVDMETMNAIAKRNNILNIAKVENSIGNYRRYSHAIINNRLTFITQSFVLHKTFLS